MVHTALVENYKLGALLGKGEFGEVKAGENRVTGQKVAIKIINMQRVEHPELIQQEIKHHLCLLHEHVVRLYEVLETADFLYLIMELVSGGDLCDYIITCDRVPEDEARRIFRQLIAGVNHCHSHHIAHRDVKPENILLDSELNVKIADFGLSAKMHPGEPLTKSCGSPNYAAPELLVKHCAYDGRGVDVWSCGVVLYAMLCGSLPFEEDNYPALFRKIKQGEYRIPGFLKDGAIDLIAQMLAVNPKERISVPEILAHSWLAEGLPIELSDKSSLAAMESQEPLSTTCSTTPSNRSSNSLESEDEHVDEIVMTHSGEKQHVHSPTHTFLCWTPFAEYDYSGYQMNCKSRYQLALSPSVPKLIAAA